MATNKKLRTPIIKPRKQGGTFYTFSSAMEDIGLNINDANNKVELSHYALLDIPAFDCSFETKSVTQFDSSTKNTGDYMFAEGLQNYVMNLETVIRNSPGYNFSALKTVSERAFWKWMKSSMNMVPAMIGDEIVEGYMHDSNEIVKAFGAISAGAQRSDEYGLYNETFVQIPSSYGKEYVMFKSCSDENYKNGTYTSTSQSGLIENISESEVDATTKIIKSTGISGKGSFDNISDKSYSISDSENDCLELEMSLKNLRRIYSNDNLTYDDIAMGYVDDAPSDRDFDFNAILVYYSIYDKTGKTEMATNAYGIYILNNSSEYSSSDYKIPSLRKKASTPSSDGTSYSFRINIKTASAYSGDITLVDKSTASYSMSYDFNDVMKNMTSAINVMKSNAEHLSRISSEYSETKRLATDAISKVTDIENTVNAIKLGDYFSTALVNDIYSKDTVSKGSAIDDSIINDIINAMEVSYVRSGSTSKPCIGINTDILSQASRDVASGMVISSNGERYDNIASILAIVVQYIKNNR